jgi:hypothetical protein
MEPNESGALGGGSPAGIAPAALARAGPAADDRAHVWPAALVGAVVAILGAGLAGELTNGVFQPEMEMVANPFGKLSPQATAKTVNAAEMRNAIVAQAVLGCAIGLAFGLAGWLAGGKLGRAIIVALVAQAVGALVGALAAWALARLLYRSLIPNMNDLTTPILIHASIWAAIGAVGGIAFALGAGRLGRAFPAAAAACVAGFAASALYQLFGDVFFPGGGATEVVATSRSVRLLGVGLYAVLIAGAAALAISGGNSTSNATVRT